MYLIKVKAVLFAVIIFSYQAIGSTPFELTCNLIDGIRLAVTLHPEENEHNDVIVTLYILY